MLCQLCQLLCTRLWRVYIGRKGEGVNIMTTKLSRRFRWRTVVIGMTLVLGTVTSLTYAQSSTSQSDAASTSTSTADQRVERDLLGEKQIPANAYYGVQTARALENFQLSGVPINHYPGFIEAWAIVKLAAAQANTDVGAMKPERLAAIEKAAQA